MSEDLKAMLQKCLNKDPKLRATVTDLFNDDWVTDKGENPLEFEVREGDLNDVNDEDIKNAFTKSFLNQRVNITAKLKANLNKTRSNIEKMKSFVNEEDNTRNVNKWLISQILWILLIFLLLICINSYLKKNIHYIQKEIR